MGRTKLTKIKPKACIPLRIIDEEKKKKIYESIINIAFEKEK